MIGSVRKPAVVDVTFERDKDDEVIFLPDGGSLVG